MKILHPEQIKKCDESAIALLKISSLELMERAAFACVKFITEKIPLPDRVIIFCGKGNNGGDGLAIARLLLLHNYKTEVYSIEHSSSESKDHAENRKRYKGTLISVNEISSLNIDTISNTIIIDAILGNGLNRPVDGIIKQAIEKMNSLNGFKLAIDIPTGLYAALPTTNEQTIFKADKTLTFETPKLNFLMKENFSFTGDFVLLSIGWPEEVFNQKETDYYFTTAKEITSIYKKRKRFVSKHDLGHALILAGSTGKSGAAILATRACLRSGAGLITTCSSKSVCAVLQSSAPEAMCISDNSDEYISTLPDLQKYTSIAIGPGIGLNPETKKITGQLIQQCTVPLVIDADALNVLAENQALLNELPANTILTPHFKEFDRLTKRHATDLERLITGIEFAKKYKVVLILKGAYSAVINRDGKVYFNSTGNPSLAKGGTGDTLTGIIAAQLAQGYLPLNAAILSVYLHGLAADICTEHIGTEAVLASDLIEALGGAYQKISTNS
jgi:hydroxyethylthiazole kinase-like uncharacterized protein yjeF